MLSYCKVIYNLAYLLRNLHILLTHCGIAMPCDDTWLTLAQVMMCCLIALSHYPNRCWIIISELFHRSAISKMFNTFTVEMSLEINNSRLHPRLPGANELINLFIQVWFCFPMFLSLSYRVERFRRYPKLETRLKMNILPYLKLIGCRWSYINEVKLKWWFMDNVFGIE